MKRLLTLLLALGMFANSQAQVVECIDPSLIDPFGFCSLIFLPVCGCDGVDYSNECVGEKSAGVTDFFDPFVSCAQIVTDCLAPARNLTTDVSAGSIVFEWDYPIGNAAIAYRVRGRVSGTTAWANGPVVTASFPSTSFALPTSVLSSGTTYEWQVQTSCAPLGANVAPESASSFFTAPGARVAADNNGFAIYPNPATDVLNLSYMTTESAAYTYQVVDMMGKLHMTGTLDLEGGMQQTTLDVSELGVGMFTLVLESGETKLVERFYHEK